MGDRGSGHESVRPDGVWHDGTRVQTGPTIVPTYPQHGAQQGVSTLSPAGAATLIQATGLP